MSGPAHHTAIEYLVSQAGLAGLSLGEIEVSVVGGADLFAAGKHDLSVGQRNVESAQAALYGHGLRPRLADTGGTTARCVTLEVGSGSLSVERVPSTREPAELSERV